MQVSIGNSLEGRHMAAYARSTGCNQHQGNAHGKLITGCEMASCALMVVIISAFSVNTWYIHNSNSAHCFRVGHAQIQLLALCPNFRIAVVLLLCQASRTACTARSGKQTRWCVHMPWDAVCASLVGLILTRQREWCEVLPFNRCICLTDTASLTVCVM
jgi:hypothetical protein